MKRRIRQWRHKLKQQVLRPLGWFFYDLRKAVGKFLRKLFPRIRDWGGRRRRGRHLLFGLPALLVGIGVAVLIAAVLLDSRVDLTTFYQIDASQQLRARNFAAARIAYERLATLTDSRSEHRFGLALAILAAGDEERGMAMVNSLAPLDEGGGHPPAHLWLATRLLHTKNPPRRNIDLAERHLLRVLQLRPGAVDAHAKLGQLYVQTNRAEQAEKHLVVAADTRPEFGLLLAGLYQSRGQKQQSRSWAEKSGQLFAGQLETNPADDAARLNLAESRSLMGEYPQAMKLLQDGLARTGERIFRSRIAKLCATWIDSLSGDGEKEQGQRLTLLETGLKYDPNQLDLLQRLMKLSRLQGPQAEQAREMLQTLLAKGQGSLTLNLILGIDAFERGKLDQARQHLDQAHKLDPNFAVVANNFAWVLAHSEPPELERSLTIINTVLDRFPKDFRFRETRGQILAKMGRWNEAILDLQASLPHYKGDRNLHKTLAEAYKQLGNPEMAAQHAKLAEAAPAPPPGPLPKKPEQPPGAEPRSPSP